MIQVGVHGLGLTMHSCPGKYRLPFFHIQFPANSWFRRTETFAEGKILTVDSRRESHVFRDAPFPLYKGLNQSGGSLIIPATDKTTVIGI